MKKIFLIPIVCLCFNLCLAQFQEKVFTNIPNLNNSKCVWGDINHDGRQDLVLMGEQPDKYVTSIYINNNDHFSKMIVPELIPLSNGSLSLLDFNNDNYLDLFYTGMDTDGIKHTLLFKNINGNSYVKMATSFENVNLSSHTWFDFNNDGFLDLVLSGLNDKNQIITKTYINNKNESFYSQEHNLASIYSGSTTSIDYDKDGWTDLLITGKSEGARRICYLYRNEKGIAFHKVIELDGVTDGDSKWGDINNDGFPDLVIAGYDGENYQSRVYTNNKGTLQFSQNLSVPLGGCDLEWLDYDGDEDLDLISIGGINNTSPKTVLYTNDNGLLSNSNIVFPNVFAGCLAVTDFNGDDKADIFISGTQIPEGPKSLFYTNNFSFSYEKPAPPTLLNSVTSYPNVSLNWNKGSDDISTPSSLQYRLKLGTTADRSEFYPFYTNLTTGENLLTSQHELSDTTIELANLSEGKYYWALQSVDIAGNISELSDSHTFFINAPISLGEDLNVCPGEQIQLSIPDGNYTANWYSKSKGEIASNTNKISLSITTNDTVWVKLNKNYGGVVYDTINIFYHENPIIELNNETYSCYGESISLHPITNGTIRTWKTFQNKILSNNLNYNVLTTEKDSLIFEVQSEYGCVAKDTSFIFVHELPVIDLKDNYFACKNQQITIQTSDYYKTEWLNQNKNLLFENTNKFTYKVDKEYEFYLKVENKEGCSSEQKFTLHPYSLPSAYAGKDTLICEGSEIELGPDVMAEGGRSPYRYIWTSSNNNFVSEEMHPKFKALQSTEFALKITDSNGCENRDTTEYNINPISNIDAGLDKSICVGESLELGGNPTAQNSLREYKYLWIPSTGLNNPNIANPTATPLTSTEYQLVVSTHNCENLTDKIKVNVHQTPIITIKPDTIVGAKQEFKLWAKGANTYEWTPELPLNDPSSNSPIASIPENTIFSVIGYSEFGCQSDQKNISVHVNNEIFIPTLFSPNKDGNNDRFLVYGTGLSKLTIRIYNNWGKVVYSSNNNSEIQKTGWDGKNNGKNIPEGNYIWELEGSYSDGRYLKKTGTIYLIR